MNSNATGKAKGSFAALFAKEFRLVMHPAAWFMLALSLLVLAPNYPAGIVLIWLVLGSFFNALNAREQHDLTFDVGLPVSRRDIVASRIGATVVLQLASVVLMLAGCLAREGFDLLPQLYTGLPANFTLLGCCLIAFVLFNSVFYPWYFKDPHKVGLPFVVASVVMGLFVAAFEVAPYVWPWFGSVLGQPGFVHLDAQLAFFAACALVYAVAAVALVRVCAARFERVDY